eukprot:c12742_g1_i2 orf=341-565(-)
MASSGKPNLPVLRDLTWRLGVTAANDELKTVGRTFVQINLVLDHKSIFLELSLSEFYEFLASLEKLKARLDNIN